MNCKLNTIDYSKLISINDNYPSIKFTLNGDYYNTININKINFDKFRNSPLFIINHIFYVDEVLDLREKNDNIIMLYIDNNFGNLFFILCCFLQCYTSICNDYKLTSCINEVFNKNYICTYKKIRYETSNDYNKTIVKSLFMSSINIYDKKIINDIYNVINNNGLCFSVKYIDYMNNIQYDNNENLFLYNKVNKINVECFKDKKIKELNNIIEIVPDYHKEPDESIVIIPKSSSNIIRINDNNIKKIQNNEINQIIIHYEYYANQMKNKLKELMTENNKLIDELNKSNKK